MKTNNNKIHSFFIAFSLLFWNPLSFFWLYGDTTIFSEQVLHIFYWIYSIIFMSGLLLIYLVWKNKFDKKNSNIIFTLFFTGILISILVITDRVIGLTLKLETEQVQKIGGLIFEPNSKASYQTIEFDYVADINSLGLRDREIHIEKGDNYRILCFGDSWTFGWGVNVENSWPKKLEQYLLANGFENIEVINCGRAGQYTSTYENYIRQTVPLLKPDLVLVGVLQGDDLAQLYETNFKIPNTNAKTFTPFFFVRKTKSVLGRYLKCSFKNILSLLSNKESKTIEIKSAWETSSTSIINDFTHQQKKRFYTLDDTVQSLFKTGNLSPGLLPYYINFPERLAIFNNPNHPATKFSIQEMNKDFTRMRHTCDKYNSELIFVNLPSASFTGHKVIRFPNDVLNSYFETNNHIDSIYNSIANTNNLQYMELTKHFISLQNKSEYFFKYDGHPNEKGYNEIAKYIGDQLIEQENLGENNIIYKNVSYSNN